MSVVADGGGVAVREIFSGLFVSLDGVVQADVDWQYAYFDEEMFVGVTGPGRVPVRR